MADKPRASLLGTAALRAAAAAAVAESTLREVAQAIGVSKSALHYFLRGGEPHAATALKLRRWLVRTSAARQSRHAATSAEAVRAALTLLVAELPTEVQQPTADHIVDLVVKAAGGRPPSWFAAIVESSTTSPRQSPPAPELTSRPRGAPGGGLPAPTAEKHRDSRG